MSEHRPRGATASAGAIPGPRAEAPDQQRRLGRGLLGGAASASVGAAARSGRGLPASGAIAVALGAGIGGGMVDVLTGPGLRALFAVAFVVGCMVAAAVVRRQSLLAAVVTPPLAYVALALAAAAVQQETASTSWLLRQVFELLTALITGAPVLITATAGAAVVALLRLSILRRPPAVVRLPPG